MACADKSLREQTQTPRSLRSRFPTRCPGRFLGGSFSEQGLTALGPGSEISRLCLMVTSDPFRHCILSAARRPAAPACPRVCPWQWLSLHPSVALVKGGLLDVSLFVSSGPRKPGALFPRCEKAAELIPDYRGTSLLWLCVAAPRPGLCPALCRAACPGLLGASCANLFWAWALTAEREFHRWLLKSWI